MTDGAWRPRDCHAHSTFSDGALSPDAVVARAAARGVRPSITDHLSGDVSLAVATVSAVRDYVNALSALAEREPDLAWGGEFCWHDALWRELLREPRALWNRFTHTVGSLHAVWLDERTYLHAFHRRWPEGLTVRAYMELHVSSIEQLAREMPVDVFAHPTLLPLALREQPLEEIWNEAHEERAVRALASAGIAFEISNRYRPHERFVRRALDAGVRLSLGSDGHSFEQVADVAWPLSVARSLGVRDEDLYDPMTHGRRT